MKRTFLGLALLFALLGIMNASYLSWSAMLGAAPTCFLNSGCDIVAASPYSRVFGIPLALFGVFFYTMAAGFSLWGVLKKNAPVPPFLLGLASVGFALSLYFLYLQAFVIGAYCEYCLFSLFDATALFLIALILVIRRASLREYEEGRDRIHTV